MKYSNELINLGYGKTSNLKAILAISPRGEHPIVCEYLRNAKLTLSKSHLDEKLSSTEKLEILATAEKFGYAVREGKTFIDDEMVTNLIKGFRETKFRVKSSNLKDILINLQVPHTSVSTNLRYRIKSSLRSLSILFGSKQSTSFIYEINSPAGYNPETVNELNGRFKFKSRFKMLEKNGCELVFHDLESEIFRKNLQMVDSYLPKLLGAALYYYYSGKSKSEIISVLEVLKKFNPLDFDFLDTHPIYEYKLRKCLTAMVLGMTSDTLWDGNYSAYGYCLTITKDGEKIIDHLYNEDEFQDFLLHHSKLDVPDSGRHEFGKVFKKDDRFFIRLNLQIRYNT